LVLHPPWADREGARQDRRPVRSRLSARVRLP
jgi:hypothetical protein